MKGVDTFRRVRKKLGWTAYKMAKALEISQTQYNYCEQKAQSVNTKTLVKLQKISGIPINEFWEMVKKDVAEVEK